MVEQEAEGVPLKFTQKGTPHPAFTFELMLRLGRGLTVTGTTAVMVGEQLSVMVTVYVVATVGLTAQGVPVNVPPEEEDQL